MKENDPLYDPVFVASLDLSDEEMGRLREMNSLPSTGKFKFLAVEEDDE